jgi:hypothetical protein
MKKSLLFISAIFIGISSYAQYEGFENWTNNSVQILDDYETSASERGIEGALATYRVADPVTGTYSIKLETVISPSNGDTIFGYFLSGDPDTQAPGQPISIGAVDSIVGWYKCDIQSGDSAGIICMPTLLGNPTGGGIYYFTGTQSTWKRFAFNVGAIASDSMMFAVATGDPMNDFDGIAGTWIQFDDIQLKGPTGTMNILNYSFENWSPVSWEEPNSWATFNLWAIGQPTMPAIKSTDSYAGTYALDLSVVQSTEGDTLWGAATNGYWGYNGAAGGQPFTGSPSAVECWYKYTPVAGDNAFFSVEFKAGGSTIGNYGNNFNTPANTYTLWTQAITPLTPDTILIAIWAGNNIGSQFKIDNIDFVFPVGIAEGLTVDKLVAYPNPATDVLKIKFNIENDNNVSIRLIDALGKELTTRSLGHLSSGVYRESFNTSDFSTGVYFLEFTLGDEKLVKRFAIK